MDYNQRHEKGSCSPFMELKVVGKVVFSLHCRVFFVDDGEDTAALKNLEVAFKR